MRDTLIFAAGLVLLGMFHLQAGPRFGTAQYSVDGKEEQALSLPISVDSRGSLMAITIPFTLGSIHPTVFQFVPDDCVEKFIVNNHLLPDDMGKFCLSAGPRVLNLGTYLRLGMNTVELSVRNTGGVHGADMRTATTDPVRMGEWIVLTLLLTWYCASVSLRLARYRWLAAPVITGIVLRMLYTAATPASQRAYDYDGHIEYIQYVLQHWTIPAGSAGWEFHQAPLYYFLSALWVKFCALLGAPVNTALGLLQFWSVTLSIGALIVCAWIAIMLLRGKKSSDEHDAASLFVWLCATMPSLVMYASRITNETLFHFLGFLAFALFIRWWQRGGMRTWILLIIAVALTCLTKINGIILLPAIALCLLWRQRTPRKQKIRAGFIGLLLIVVLVGWMPVVRLGLESDVAGTVTFGTQRMNGALRVERTLRNTLAFNPVAVANIPFNDTWSDAHRRDMFWEFFFRSAFFGEFRFPSLQFIASSILVLSMLCLPVMAGGIFGNLGRHAYETAPVWLTAGLTLLAGFSFALLYPYSSTQDFRFSILLLPSLFYFVVWPVQILRGIPGMLITSLLMGIALLSGIFMLAVSLSLF